MPVAPPDFMTPRPSAPGMVSLGGFSFLAERRLTNAEQSAKVIDAPQNMKALIALTFITIIGWTAAVTFCGPELYRLINGPEPVKAKVTHR